MLPMDFPKDQINADAKYYALEFSGDEEGHIFVGGQTQWVGWADSESRVELREPSLVYPDRMAAFWIEFGLPFHVVNTVDDFIRWFLYGGHALVERAIAAELLSNALKPAACVKTGNKGFTSLRRLPPDLFRPATTPKQRMSTIKRDGRRCRVCGRSPERHVDIELHVHHIRPHGQGGATHEDNLITLCHTCHAGLNPHYDWSLFSLLEDTSTDIKTRERQKYLKSVQAYRAARQKFLKELREPNVA